LGDGKWKPSPWAFSAPQRLDSLDTEELDDDATLTRDGLHIFYGSERKEDGGQGMEDIWTAERGSLTEDWGAPSPVSAVSSPARETSAAIAPDGLTLWFSSNRPGASEGYDVWVSARSSLTEAWATPHVVRELSGPGDDRPRPPIDGNTLMPLAVESSGEPPDLYLAERSDKGAPWGRPYPIDELNTAKGEGDPFLTSDGLTLFFASDAEGQSDLMVAERPSLTEPFGEPQLVAGVNSDGSETDPFLSADGKTLYFTSDRDGTQDVYVATR